MGEILGVGLVVAVVQLRGSVCVTLRSGFVALVPIVISCSGSIVFCKTVNLFVFVFMAWWYAYVYFQSIPLDDCNSYLSYILCSSDCFLLL